jgi:general secretion pathway protein C
MVLRKVVSLAVPLSVALVAFLHAHAIGSLVDATMTPASIAPFAEARAASASASGPAAEGPSRSAQALLERNPFDHETGSLLRSAPGEPATIPDGDPFSAPACEGVRARITVGMEDAGVSFAALDVHGRRVLRKQGDAIDDLEIAYVAADRVWLRAKGGLCMARVFASGAAEATAPTTPAPASKPLEKEIASRIVKTGPGSWEIDRATVDRILEAQAELMQTPLVPDKEGDRVVGFRLVRVRPGSVLSSLGLESNDRLVSLNGVEVTSTEKMIEAYARLKTGTVDRLTIHFVRGGKPLNFDYQIR